MRSDITLDIIGGMESPTHTAPIHVVPAPPRHWYEQLPPSGRRLLTSDAAVLNLAGVSLTLHIDADRLRVIPPAGDLWPGSVVVTDERFAADVELMAPYPDTSTATRFHRVIAAAADDGFAGDIELTCTPWHFPGNLGRRRPLESGRPAGPCWAIVAATYTDAEGVRYS